MHWMLLHAVAYAAEEEVAGFTMMEMWEHSGFIARTVIILLGFMFLATNVVMVERLIAFLRARGHSIKAAIAVIKPMQAYDIDAALKAAKSPAFKAGHLPALLAAGLAELKERPNKLGIHNAERALDKVTGEQLAKLKRWFGLMASVGSTAPFVGLAGTTFGVINAFQGMASEGAGLAGVSAGISEALVTTFIGIVVAIWGVWAFNYFNGWAGKVADELNTARSDFLNWADKYVADGGVPPVADEVTDEAPVSGAEPAPAGK